MEKKQQYIKPELTKLACVEAGHLLRPSISFHPGPPGAKRNFFDWDDNDVEQSPTTPTTTTSPASAGSIDGNPGNFHNFNARAWDD